MKKSLLLVAMAVATLTASANVLKEASFFGAQSDQITNKPVVVNASAQKAPAVKADASIVGDYVLTTKVNYGTSYSDYNDSVQRAEVVTIAEDGNGGYTVSGIYQSMYADEVNALAATYADGVLSIAADQEIATNATYGKVILANATDYGTTVNRVAITFAVQADGSLVQTSGVGLVRGIPDYSTGNYTFTPYYSAQAVMKKANATLSTKDTEGVVVTKPCAIEETAEGGVVYGILDGYCGFVKSGNEVQFNQEPLNFSTTYSQSPYYFGFGVLASCIYQLDSSDDTYKWYYYTSTETASGLAPVEGTYDADLKEYTFESMNVLAYSTSYGSLRFDDYVYETKVTVNPKEPSAVTDVTNAKTVESVEYVNLDGQVSNRAFNGVNIVVTNYTDGSRSAVKVMK